MKDNYISGKTLVFTDQHFGVKGNAQSRQRIGALVIKKLLDTIDNYHIQNIIFCGDYFHQRNALTVDTLNIAYRCLQKLAEKCKTYMILGNHDLFNKNSTDINSINIFRDNPNIIVIDKPTELLINSQQSLLVPWLGDISNYKKSTYDFIFGHFEISSKFLIANYAQEHSRSLRATNDISIKLNEDDILSESGASNYHPEQYLGSFIEIAKENGTIFAGHIHQHKEMTIKNRKFIFIGSPYEQTLGDVGCKCGFYIIDANGSYRFHEIDGIPKHVQLKCSKILKNGIDNFDFNIVKNNIIQKIYDIDVSLEDDMQINKKIAAFSPYEELLPDYQVALDFSSTSNDEQHDNLVLALKKSKLDYIKNYIDQLDDETLKNEDIDKDKLFVLMSKYYNAAVGD